MIEVKGQYNTAVVYTDKLESSAEGQLKVLCDLEVYKDSRIRIMPDVHSGAGATIGTSMTLHGAVCPNAVGVDISCGMLVAKIKEKNIELQKLDKICHQAIPSGMNENELDNIHRFAENLHLEDLRCVDHVMLQKAYRSICSLGGGNHFEEIDRDDEGNLYIVIHTGSRHLGLEVANYYQQQAFNQRNPVSDMKYEIHKIVEELKSKGLQEKIPEAIKNIKMKREEAVPMMISWCTDDLFEDYIHDIKIIDEFAYWNRHAILDTIVRKMKLHVVEEFTSVHNYIDTDNMILRKGSCAAYEGQKLIIPMNMRDGSLICVGKGNPEWNYSAPHGAGRIMSRSQARESLSMSDFKKSMEGIYTTTVSRETIDEAPMAYKPMEEIISQIGDTVEIVKRIKPIYNFKAGEESMKRGKR